MAPQPRCCCCYNQGRRPKTKQIEIEHITFACLNTMAATKNDYGEKPRAARVSRAPLASEPCSGGSAIVPRPRPRWALHAPIL